MAGRCIRQSRNMPTLSRIADHWAVGGHADVFGNRVTFVFALSEPVCFRCGWLAPLPDMYATDFAAQDPWRYANGWLQRAHLAERSADGPDTVDNLVPMCSLCHRQMPEQLTRDAAVAWINNWERDSRNPFWQAATDMAWSGDKYTAFPGTGNFLIYRLQIDDYYRRAQAQMRELAAA